MKCRVVFFIVFLLALSFLLLQGTSFGWQATASCDSATCGDGYRAELQSNGSCMCVAVDCIDVDNCPEPPKAVEDCDSIEGCNPPRIIEP